MLNRSLNTLFILMVALGCFCGINERLQSFQKRRSQFLEIYSDTSKPFAKVQSTLNQLWMTTLEVPFPHSQTFEELVSVLLSKKSDYVSKMILEKHGTIDLLKEKIRNFITESFMALTQELVKIDGQSDTAVSEEVLVSLKEMYFDNISVVLNKVPAFSKTEALIKAANYLNDEQLKEEKIEDLKIEIEVANYIKAILLEKFNEFSRLNLAGTEKSISEIESFIAEFVRKFNKTGARDITSLLKTLLNADYYINNEIAFIISRVLSEDSNKDKDLEEALARSKTVIKLFHRFNDKCNGRQRLESLVKLLIYCDNELMLDEKNSIAKQKFNLDLLENLFKLLIELNQFGFVYDSIKTFVGSKTPSVSDVSYIKVLKHIIKLRGHWEVKRASPVDQLFYFDVIAHSSFNESSEHFDESKRITLTKDELVLIVNNFQYIADMHEDSMYLEVWSDSKIFFVANILNLDDNLDFFASLYFTFAQFMVVYSESITSLDWGMLFDAFIEQRSASPKAVWLRGNYFKLKVYNVFLYSAKTKVNFKFQNFMDNSDMSKGAIEFVKDPRNKFFTQRLKSVYKNWVGDFDYKDDLTEMLKFYSGFNTNTEKFVFLKASVQTKQTTNQLEVPNQQKDLPGIMIRSTRVLSSIYITENSENSIEYKKII